MLIDRPAATIMTRVPTENHSTQSGIAPRSPEVVSFRTALRTWTYIGLNSFGGPAGQIAVMHRVLVEQKRWISEGRFLHALNYCMLLPGPEAMQLATYVGWLMHGTRGGLAAGILFVLPGFVSILGLSLLYAAFHETTLFEAVFFGLKPAVLAVVVEAVVRIGRRALKTPTMWLLALAAFVSLFLFNVPFPAVVLGAGLVGLVCGRLGVNAFAPIKPHVPGSSHGTVDAAIADGVPEHTRPSLVRSIRTLVVCVALWFAPLAIIAASVGTANVYFQQGVFFSKAAMVTFGGAYAVLAYVQQQAVEVYGWLTPGEMLDGLGLAETTPGPLIMVVQFVGFMGAFRDAAGLHPMLAGTLASLLVTWVTFVPCFLWIFLGAPYVESVRGNRALSAALSAITAAVVGVILNLAAWFALHTLFAQVGQREFGVISISIPEWRSVSIPSLIISLLALVLLLRLKVGMLTTLAICAIIGAGWRMAT